MQPPQPQRVLEFERCVNFRDLGGYATADGHVLRWRTLFRSMTPEYMTEADAAKARTLGIETVIDLRGRRFKTSGPLGEPPAKRVVLGSRRSLVRNRQSLREFVEASPEEALQVVLDRQAPIFARALTRIANSRGNVLFHCRLGKDRSGVLTALLLKTLGVGDDQVIEDYMLSGLCLEEAKRLIEHSGEQVRVDPQIEARVASAPPKREAMEAVLHRLAAEHGGAPAYFEKQGVGARTLARLRRKLLEAGPSVLPR